MYTKKQKNNTFFDLDFKQGTCNVHVQIHIKCMTNGPLTMYSVHVIPTRSLKDHLQHGRQKGDYINNTTCTV